jgi:hypothetical protein
MSAFLPGIPEPGEYKPAFGGYVGRAVSFSDPVQKLTDQLEEVLSLLRPLDAKKQAHRYADGKWSVKEVLGHLTDTERVMAYRALSIGSGDLTSLPSFDENAFAAAAEADRADWSDLLDEFTHVRRATILMLRRLPKAAWVRVGTASDAPISVRALAYIMIGHVAHHLEILRERYL